MVRFFVNLLEEFQAAIFFENSYVVITCEEGDHHGTFM